MAELETKLGARMSGLDAEMSEVKGKLSTLDAGLSAVKAELPEVEARLSEQMRDMQTELLKAFLPWQEHTQIQFPNFASSRPTREIV